MSALTKVYEELALERPHVCSNCGVSFRLSHSHLVPRSINQNLIAEKNNIQFHCLSLGEKIGCHEKWSSMNAVFMKDFMSNMAYIYTADETYFWKRMFKLQEHWEKKNSVQSSLETINIQYALQVLEALSLEVKRITLDK